MQKLYLILLVNIFIVSSLSSAQSKHDTLFIAFWNLENLFDTIDDTQKNDEQFLPDGDKEWTEERLDIKLNHLARVIRSMNNSNGPDLLGVCEVEHQSMLDSLIARYLDDFDYNIAYVESPDKRGIDNGLIYNSNIFEVLSVRGDTVHLKDNWPTRPIVNVKLLYKSVDTLSVYINHWPSRSGGKEASEHKRIAAATTLCKAVDEDFAFNMNARIIVLGDFNDEPTNVSVLETLRANTFKCDSLNSQYLINTKGELFNTSYQDYEDGLGTFDYQSSFLLYL